MRFTNRDYLNGQIKGKNFDDIMSQPGLTHIIDSPKATVSLIGRAEFFITT